MSTLQQDPNAVLKALTAFLVVDHARASVEWARGQRAITDQDRMNGPARALTFLHSITQGETGMSSAQLAAVRDAAEVSVR